VNFLEQVERWLEEGDLGAVRAVLAGFRQQGDLARLYGRFFAKQRELGARLVAAGLGSLTDDRVLARLSRILEERPDAVRFLLRAWLEDAREDLEALAGGAWPFEQDRLPRPEWWRAAARFLEASGRYPRWEWLGRFDPYRSAGAPEPMRGSAALGARLKRLVAELEQVKAALRTCEAREREARTELEEVERRREEFEQRLLSLEGELRERERKIAARDLRIGELEERMARLQSQLKGCEERARPEEAPPEPQGVAGEAEASPGLKSGPPMPFDPHDLEGVWVIPYGELAGEARDRLRRLIGLYEAALRGEEHPDLARTNWPSLGGRPRGLLLLGTDRLLDDMARLPLLRWIEASLFTREAYLFGLRRWVRARNRALLDSE